jgi:OmpA-OmpF porin, OOP family
MNVARKIIIGTLLIAVLVGCGARTRISSSDPSTSTSAPTASSNPSPSTSAPVSSTVAVDASSTTNVQRSVPVTTTVALAPSSPTGVSFPLIPTIVVPDITSFGAGEQAVTAALGEYAKPFEGLSVADARCKADGTVFSSSGITTFGSNGSTSQVGERGVIEVDADGSGSAVFDGGVVTVNGDGSGSAVVGGVVVDINRDLSGNYVGPIGVIDLNADGSGRWVGNGSVISVDGRGAGSWTGSRGVVENRGDGSGTWTGEKGIVVNNGDGTGTIDNARVKMEPLPKVPPVGKFPPVANLVPAGRSCGTVITLGDEVLFDFDKADLRPEAAPVLDKIATYLVSSKAAMQINGHTDSIGTDEYNQQLSERRAQAVWSALQTRGVVAAASVNGFGKTQPVAPNSNADGSDNPAGRQLNRRVEIVILD